MSSIGSPGLLKVEVLPPVRCCGEPPSSELLMVDRSAATPAARGPSCVKGGHKVHAGCLVS